MLRFVAGSPLTSITIFGSCSKHFLLVFSQEDGGAAASDGDDDDDDDDDCRLMCFPSLCRILVQSSCITTWWSTCCFRTIHCDRLSLSLFMLLSEGATGSSEFLALSTKLRARVSLR